MMRFALTGAVIGAVLTALPAAADSAPKAFCFPSYQIDHTSIPDDSTILFHMRNHKIYKAAMINKCVGLRLSTRGFTYSPTDPGSDEICANLLTIRVNDTGETCLVGAITPVDAPAPGGGAGK